MCRIPYGQRHHLFLVQQIVLTRERFVIRRWCCSDKMLHPGISQLLVLSQLHAPSHQRLLLKALSPGLFGQRQVGQNIFDHEVHIFAIPDIGQPVPFRNP